jgi:serine phosphatase RsbU (regulator of sigma subunit)
MPQGVDRPGPADAQRGAAEAQRGAVGAATARAGERTSAGRAAREGAVAPGSAEAGPRPDGQAGRERRLRAWFGRRRQGIPPEPPPLPSGAVTGPGVELPADDPLAGYLMTAARPVDIRELDIDSPALTALKDAGAVLVVPLISAGALVGVLSLGPRRSERDYSTEDLRLLNMLAGHAAPALRVGQLVREQQAQARRQERIEQELEVARLIQQHFLPKSRPDLSAWRVAAFYRPARTVGGDFYDFIPLPGGQVMVVIGDVTDKGVPAALVMASVHTLLRAAAPRLVRPGAVLAQVNDLLFTDVPANVFVTCLALVLNDSSGEVTFANAGHDVPYVRTVGGVAELRAKGMPLGLMPGSTYDEGAFAFQPGDCALLHSDGLSEAHSASREMFGFHRVAALVGTGATGQALIDRCLAELDAFTGPGHEQEDDITLLSLERTGAVSRGRAS